MTDRSRRLNLIALTIVVIYATVAAHFVSDHSIVNPVVDALLIFVTSLEFYRLLIDLTFKLVCAVPLLMKLYWGRLYVEGLWSYTYTLEGGTDGHIYFGVWRFEQTLYDIRVVGFGLSDSFEVRSRVRSATEMISNGPLHEIVNIRTDSIDPGTDYYSRTTMYFEPNKNKVIRYPIRMRGKSIVYGGPRTGFICNNLFIRHEAAQTEQDVIDELEQNFLKYGRVHPSHVDIRLAAERDSADGAKLPAVEESMSL